MRSRPSSRNTESEQNIMSDTNKTGKRVLKAWSIGKWLRTLLKEGFFVTQHVFSNTIYLRNLHTDRLLLLSLYKWRSPFTVNIKRTKNLDFQKIVKPEDYAFFAKDRIEFEESSLVIDLSEAKVYDNPAITPPFHPMNKMVLKKLVTALSLLAGKSEKGLDEKIVSRICSFYGEKSFFSDEALNSLIGAGEGFTPAGDDFYNGYLALISVIERSLDIQVEIPFTKIMQLLDKTTWASSEYLRYSFDGLIDELGTKLIEALLRNDYERAVDSIIEFTRRGHNSGIYICLGIITGYSDIMFKENTFIKETFCKQ